MEDFELKPIKNKRVIFYLMDVKRILNSDNEISDIRNILRKNIFKFVTIDINNEDFTKITNKSFLKLLRNLKKPYIFLDIPEIVKWNFEKNISKHEDLIDEVSYHYNLSRNIESEKTSNLKSWIDFLKKNSIENENYFNLKIRPYWIVERLLDLITLYEEKCLYIIHLAPKETLKALRIILEKLQISVVLFDNKVEYLTPQQKIK